MTQTEKVLNYLETNGSITTYEAFVRLGITRLASRIYDLRKSGVCIETEYVTAKISGHVSTFCKYRLTGN